MDAVKLHIDGQPVEVLDVAPTTTLLEYLRGHRAKVGTKEGCAEGDCGACTVVVVDERAPRGPRFRAVNSCLLLLPSLHGKRILTVEGLADDRGLHPVQSALVEALGSQCGYCTPGVVMSMFEAHYRDDLDAPWKLDDQMCGNLCRCTGYRPIRDATRSIAGSARDDRFSAALRSASGEATPLRYEVGSQRFFAPTSFDALWDVLDDHRSARFIAGATDLGLDVTQRGARFEVLVSLEALEDMRTLTHEGGRWSIGAGVKLADLEDATDHALPPISRMLRFFGSRQIKNSATVGGNLCNASPIGDLAPVLLALDATMVLASRSGERRVPIEDFFIGYRRTALTPGEILARIELDALPSNAIASSYKVSKRREMDISAVAAGLRVDVEEGRVVGARFGFGGMAATPARAHQAEAAIVGRPWSETSCEAAAAVLARDFSPLSDHRGSAWYRARVAANLLRGFFFDTAADPMPRLSDRPSATLLGGSR